MSRTSAGRPGADDVDVERADLGLDQQAIAGGHDVEDRRARGDHAAGREELHVDDRAGDRRQDLAAALHVVGRGQVLVGLGEVALDLLELVGGLLGLVVVERQDLELGLADRLLRAGDVRAALRPAALEPGGTPAQVEQPRLALEPLLDQILDRLLLLGGQLDLAVGRGDLRLAGL